MTWIHHGRLFAHSFLGRLSHGPGFSIPQPAWSYCEPSSLELSAEHSPRAHLPKPSTSLWELMHGAIRSSFLPIHRASLSRYGRGALTFKGGAKASLRPAAVFIQNSGKASAVNHLTWAGFKAEAVQGLTQAGCNCRGAEPLQWHMTIHNLRIMCLRWDFTKLRYGNPFLSFSSFWKTTWRHTQFQRHGCGSSCLYTTVFLSSPENRASYFFKQFYGEL